MRATSRIKHWQAQRRQAHNRGSVEERRCKESKEVTHTSGAFVDSESTNSDGNAGRMETELARQIEVEIRQGWRWREKTK